MWFVVPWIKDVHWRNGWCVTSIVICNWQWICPLVGDFRSKQKLLYVRITNGFLQLTNFGFVLFFFGTCFDEFSLEISNCFLQNFNLFVFEFWVKIVFKFYVMVLVVMRFVLEDIIKILNRLIHKIVKSSKKSQNWNSFSKSFRNSRFDNLFHLFLCFVNSSSFAAWSGVFIIR